MLGGGHVIMIAQRVADSVALFPTWGPASALGVVLLVLTLLCGRLAAAAACAARAGGTPHERLVRSALGSPPWRASVAVCPGGADSGFPAGADADRHPDVVLGSEFLRFPPPLSLRWYQHYFDRRRDGATPTSFRPRC